MSDIRYNQRGVSASKEDVHKAIKNVDKVILFDKGKVIAVGSFDDLVEESIVFRGMIELQSV